MITMRRPAVGATRALRDVIRSRSDAVSCVVQVAGLEPMDGFTRITLEGAGLRGLRPRPADAIKVFLPGRTGDRVPVPAYDEVGTLSWPQGVATPQARCFTVVAADPDAGTVDLDVLGFRGGVTAAWLDEVQRGNHVSVEGVSSCASRFPRRSGLAVRSVACGQLVDAVGADDLGAATQVWIGAEQAVAGRLRSRMIKKFAVPVDAIDAKSYWKSGHTWEAMFDESLERFRAARGAGLDVTDPGVLQRLEFG